MPVADYKIKGAHCGLSGHVSHSTQQQNFQAMVHRRNNRIEVMRKHGTLPLKETRHPLRAEKTPRKNLNGHFDFSIPTGRKELKDFHKWNYPEVDYGLMGKFASQKVKYAEFAGTQKEYLEVMKKKAAAEREREEELKREADMIAEAANMPSARDSARYTGRSETSRSTAREDDNFELDLHGQAIKNFRILGAVQPEVLDQFRAERAQSYLRKYSEEKGTHPLDPPERRKLKHKTKFIAGGSTGVLSSSGVEEMDPNYVKIGDRSGTKKWGAPDLSPTKKEAARTKKATAALTKLMNQLDSTENDIRRSEERLKKLGQ